MDGNLVEDRGAVSTDLSGGCKKVKVQCKLNVTPVQSQMEQSEADQDGIFQT